MPTVESLDRGAKYRDGNAGITAVVLHRVRHPIEPDEPAFIEAYKTSDGWEHERLLPDDIEVDEIIGSAAAEQVPWRIEADALTKYTVLTERMSQVGVLYLRGWDRSDIADELGVRPNTIDSTRQAVRRRVTSAGNTPLYSLA